MKVLRCLMTLATLTLFLVGVSYATEQSVPSYTKTVSVVLHNIRLAKRDEHSGDELYLTTTAYTDKPKQRPEHQRIPRFPIYWISSHLEPLKNVPVWQGKLNDNENVTLIFSLMEHDAPPWDTDDLLGTVKLHLTNKAGVIESDWRLPNHADGKPLVVQTNAGEIEQFVFLADRAVYELGFQLRIK
ncbi:MAG: hypothetical protein Tsb005_06680 [Gammaproteobacteria bacterium]